MIIRVCFCLLFSSQLQASSQIDYNELRLQKMAKVMNARDFELMLHGLRELEVLDRACEKEQQQEKIPITCLEFAEKLKEAEVSATLDLSDFEVVCDTQISKLSAVELLNLGQKQRFLKGDCREKVLARIKILSYKRRGKNLE